jgi:type IV pilus assembly protein PilX
MNGKTMNKQSGSALIVSLVILVVMTLIGITAMGGSSLQERMAGNSRDMSIAFQAAEAALRDGESFFINNAIPALNVDPFLFDGTNTGLYDRGNMPDVSSAATWANSLPAAAVAGVTTQPRYVIERVLTQPVDSLNVTDPYADPPQVRTWARVTARSEGGTTNTQVMLQSYFGPP